MKNIKKFKNAFTFAELMVSILIISIITAILVPIIMEITPNTNKHLFRSAYKLTETVIAEMINEENNASHFKMTDEDSDNIDFEHFCENFVNKMNIVGKRHSSTGAGNATVCDAQNAYSCDVTTGMSINNSTGVVTGNLSGKCPNFTTTNGMRWFLFPKEAAVIILVDVNGARKGTNAVSGSNQDIFAISVENSGRIVIKGENEIKYLADISAD